jgi:transcriptional regulator with XRE-family HTH domain
MAGAILELKERHGWNQQELASLLELSSASIDRYTARLPRHLALKLADLAGEHGDRDLELRFRSYAEGKPTGQEKKAAFDFEALSPDQKEIAQIAVEIYIDPTPANPLEEHFGELLWWLQDLRLKNQSQGPQKKKVGKER